MKFKERGMESQLLNSHPALLEAILDLEVWSKRTGIPEPTLTEVWRTPRQQGDIYFPTWVSILLRKQQNQPLTSAELKTLKNEKLESYKTHDAIRDRAERKFSWHMVKCAADLSIKGYTAKQKDAVASYLKRRCPAPMWLVISEPHGTGPHIHVEFESFEYRKKYDPRPLVA